MPHHNRYGQYCPLALSSQLIGSRWTMLIIRELLFGSHSFNDISKGVPRMSRTLLSQRLKELTDYGLVEKSSDSQLRSIYSLTKAGEALAPIITNIAKWGQEWLNTGPLLEDIDIDLLMWDIKRNAIYLDIFPKKFIVEFYLKDAPKEKRTHWLIFENQEIEVCIIDRGFDIDVYFNSSVKALTQVWMGWKKFKDAIKDNDFVFKGNKKYISCAEKWLGSSGLSGIKRQPENLRI